MSKFPIYLQHDAMQCGVACLRMVCAHFGRQFSMEELSELCSTASAEGKAAARSTSPTPPIHKASKILLLTIKNYIYEKLSSNYFHFIILRNIFFVQ